MKTSFAEFEAFPFGGNDMTVKCYVDCEQVKAVIECFDFDLDVVDDKTELVLGPQQKIVVKGNIKGVLDTVKTFSKGMTIACQGKKS